MRKILTLIALAVVSIAAQAQDEKPGYSYVNKGINIMLEGEGAGNEAVGYGGVAFTIGSQINPNFFIGGGTKMLWGGTRYDWQFRAYDDFMEKYGDNTNTFWTDPEGRKWRFHGYYEDGTEVFMDSWDDIMDGKYGEARPVIVDERGNAVNIPDHSRGWYEADCGNNELFWMCVPYICLKYNVLGNKRVTPYLDFRWGWNVFRSALNMKYGMNSSLMGGVRIGVGEGDFAFNVSFGWAYADMRGYNEYNGKEHTFMARLGVEF